MGKSSKSKKYIIRRITDYLGALILVFVILFIWQLYRSPMPLPFLKPYIIKALNHDNADYEVTVDAVNLELVRSIQPIKIIAKDVVYKKTDESIVVKAPRTSISFSMRALIRGIISPSSIEIDKPSVSLSTTYNGGKSDGREEKYSLNEKKIGFYFNIFEEFMERFNSPDMSYPENYINGIYIKNAELEFNETDYGRKLVFTDADYKFSRHSNYIELGLTAVMDFGDVYVPIDLDVDFFPKTNVIDVDFSFKDLMPSNVVDNFMSYKDDNNFYRINLPVSGSLDVSVDFNEILANRDKVSRSLDTAITKFNFEFQGGEGNIAFSENEDLNYDVSSFLLKGSLDSGLNNIKIENADFNLGDKKTLLGLDISGIRKLILSGSAEDLKVSLKANIDELPFIELPRYWPRYIAEDAWLWVRDGIYAGYAKDAKFEFNFAYDKKKKRMDFTKLSGVAHVDNASLNYLEGMPHVNNIYGTAHFYNDKIHINIDKGISNGNNVTGGHVILYDLNKVDNFIDIRLIANSAVTDSLRLIDNPPLNYAREIGINPDSIEGDADTVLDLKFELKKDLQPEEVNVNVKSKVKNVKIKDVIKGKIIQSDELDLLVNNNGIVLSGDVKADGIDMSLEWNRAFSPPYKNIYKVSFNLNDKIKKKLGIDSAFLNYPYWHGEAGVVGVVHEADNDISANMTIDLTESAIDYNLLGYTKEKGEIGKADFVVNLNNGSVTSISDIALIKDGFEIKGKVNLDKKSEVKSVDISSIKGQRTDAKARIDIGDNNQPMKVNISGDSYNIAGLFEEDSNEKKTKKASNNDGLRIKERLKNVPDTDINIAVNSLWTNKDVPITNFAGSVSLRNNVGINEIKLIGNYSYKKDLFFKFEYLPRVNGEYSIEIASNDAGSTLKVLRLYDYMAGGNLSISAKKDVEDKIIGHAKIRNFSLMQTNILSRLLSIASLTGILDMLRGDGIVFSHFDAPFVFKGGVLEVEDAKTFGKVLGITADGNYNYENGDLNFRGTIAPAYSINRFFGSIPVIGRLLSGEDKTIFAANYRARGNVSNPDVNINPLSAISPNSLKELFSESQK
ncbi:MAG: DUF3971 domain-containing protein [Lactobacillaceae bacterium]|jgi:hypothetical protein|nr:DUF3971 domain-containing protein [Lactobacillaceae bacterium]